MPATHTVPVDENGLPEFIDTRKDGTAIVKRQPALFNDAELREISDFKSVLEAAKAKGLAVTDSGDEIGNGFSLLDDKRVLVGKELVIIDWKFTHRSVANGADEDADFVTMLVITDTGEKWIVNDGSTGIYKQLSELGDPHVIHAAKGLRVSDYKYTDDKGKTSAAATFYISTDK